MLYLVRHGRTASNASGLLLGRADPPLDAVGETQADRLAGALREVDRIIASPLTRTMQTAAAIGARHGIDVELDDRMIELDYGEWDQRPLESVTAEQWAAWRADVDFTPPGGESLRTLGIRVRSALDDLADEAADRNVVVVTHVSPVKAGVAWAIDVGDDLAWRMFVAPASITRISTARGTRSLHGFNESPADP